MITIRSNFIGDFKLGDNIVYNLSVLNSLYSAQNVAPHSEKKYFAKPIVVVIASICEAVLHDFYGKVMGFVQEGVPGMSNEELEELRRKSVDDFSKYISVARSRKLLGDEAQIYEDLEMIRVMRNRIHIQNVKQQLQRDEKNVFSENKQSMCEKTITMLLREMEARYSRRPELRCVRDFQLPWS